jgi:hypothetical protein
MRTDTPSASRVFASAGSAATSFVTRSASSALTASMRSCGVAIGRSVRTIIRCSN